MKISTLLPTGLALVLFTIARAAAAISAHSLIDHFDPGLGLSVNGQGQVTSWSNRAGATRGVTTGSIATSVVQLPNGRPMVRFASSVNGGSLSYPSPGAAALANGYTIFAVVRLSPTANPYPRIHRGADDSHALYLNTANGYLTVKANPLASALRPARHYASSVPGGSVAILTARLRPNRQELFVNGSRVSSSSASISSYAIDSQTFQIGDSVAGDIGHVLVYGSGATDEDLNETGATLAGIYGLSWGGLADLPLPPPPAFAPSHPPLMQIVAHRGNSSEAPENTLAAIRAAAGVAHMTEFDVYATADGELILIHDQQLNRTTNGTGSVASSNYHGGIDGLDAGSWFSPEFAGEPVPLLSQAVTTALDLGLVPVIEHKTGSAAAYHAKLSELGALEKVHVISFDWNFLAQFRQLSPRTAIGALSSGALTRDRIEQAYAFGANYVDWVHTSIGAPEMELARSARLPVMVWTANEETRMRELIALGVSSITTDKPSLLKSILPSFDDWSGEAEQGLSEGARGFDDDPDGDRLPNGLELVLGQPPIGANPDGVRISTFSSTGAGIFRHPLTSRMVEGVYHRYLWSRDLETWHANGSTAEDGLKVILQPEITTYSGPSGVHEVTVHVRPSGPPAGRLFFKIEALRR